MKILFVDFTLPYLLKDSEYPVGGWAVELNTWLKGLSANNIHAGVLSWKGAKQYVGGRPGFDLIDTYDPEKGLKVFKYLYSYIPLMFRAAKRYEPDVIIQACSGVNTAIMAFIAKRLGVPFVYRVANDMDVDERYKIRLRKYEQIAYRFGLSRASAFLCQNQYQYQCLLKQYPKKHIYTLHNPFDVDKVVSDTAPRSKRNYIAWIGFFSKQKNLPLLLSIAKEVPIIEFRIAGMPSKTIDKDTISAINKLTKLKNVKFVGYLKRSEIFAFLSEAKALLSTSHYEGFSNTLLESFATGTPVIAPLKVDPDYIITRNRLGFTAEHDDEMHKLVIKLFNLESDKYTQMGYRCQRYLIDNHAPATKAGQLTAFLSQMVGCRL